jgi:MFS family permease
MLELGALVGALTAGTLSERVSRTGGICIACGKHAVLYIFTQLMTGDSVVFCVGSAFQCLANSLFHLIIGRAIGGVGVGALRLVNQCMHSSRIDVKGKHAMSALSRRDQSSRDPGIAHGH